MTPKLGFVRNSTHLVELVGLIDNATGLYLTDATVTGDLLDPSGAVVSGGAGITLTHVSGTTGAGVTYRGVLPGSIVFGAGMYRFRARITDTNNNLREVNFARAAVDG